MERNSNIELLRIIRICGITVHHLIYHSTIMEVPLGMNRLFAQFFLLLGKGGVNIFVLISGYFLIKTEPLDYKLAVKRVGKLWKQLFLYAILIGGTTCFVFQIDISISKLAKTFFPTLTGAYWLLQHL